MERRQACHRLALQKPHPHQPPEIGQMRRRAAEGQRCEKERQLQIPVAREPQPGAAIDPGHVLGGKRGLDRPAARIGDDRIERLEQLLIPTVIENDRSPPPAPPPRPTTNHVPTDW
jgi:hypothetical protein